MSLLKRDPKNRIGYHEPPPSPCTRETYRNAINYDMIKKHSFFSTSYAGHTPINFNTIEKVDVLKNGKPPLQERAPKNHNEGIFGIAARSNTIGKN